jgi:mono/diheme cytochrome c family protein
MNSSKNEDPSNHTRQELSTAAAQSRAAGVADLAAADPREYVEPGENHRPMTLLYVLFLCAFFAWAGFYTQRYSGGYKGLVYDENDSGMPARSNIVAVVDPYVLGQRVFANTCSKCHQLDGQGLPGQYPPLVGSEWALASGPARMIRIVLDGVQGPITVKGMAFNNNMASHRDALNDQQLAAVITYVRTQKDWAHDALPVTPEEVAAIRKKTKDRPALGAWTVPELLAIPENEPPQ